MELHQILTLLFYLEIRVPLYCGGSFDPSTPILLWLKLEGSCLIYKEIHDSPQREWHVIGKLFHFYFHTSGTIWYWHYLNWLHVLNVNCSLCCFVFLSAAQIIGGNCTSYCCWKVCIVIFFSVLKVFLYLAFQSWWDFKSTMIRF